jgi:hypothetical protein
VLTLKHSCSPQGSDANVVGYACDAPRCDRGAYRERHRDYGRSPQREMVCNGVETSTRFVSQRNRP